MRWRLVGELSMNKMCVFRVIYLYLQVLAPAYVRQSALPMQYLFSS